MTSDERFMHRCLQLAKNGLGTTYPNPLVGCVIVHDEKIIGEGWHQKAGAPHAEVHAVRSVENTNLLNESTIYVSLEPCSHFGKTPPCSDLIIEKGIKKVVIGSTDPNPKVAGKGIQKLKAAGCEVITGILEQKCHELNKRFFTFHSKNRPYILLKWAQSRDGFLAPLKRDQREPVWITNEYARQWVHKMRSEEQAILVGTQTVLDDDPTLTTRSWNGTSPTRIILDRQLRIPTEAKVFQGETPTVIINEQKEGQQGHLNYMKMDFSEALASQICSKLRQLGLQSLIVEGGAQTLQTFIDSGFWDEAWVFKGHLKFGEGLKAPILTSASLEKESRLREDLLTLYKNRHS
ncbi:MAG: bifunctional diaminohydroxyphosphoribosylaminopyrimidine deaminase/5-amino-6-(5-phosphoribosylamino)uracil reductase RibD [Flavobacteriaceae bacterium]|nr:bifunctional diaminohydroxyphosphoribosylaminopyrimidine deaminase/5-amino-6-(5-phosphoribosylamino)uracil reductase RibD [Flavobacteriaceae bacterium]